MKTYTIRTRIMDATNPNAMTHSTYVRVDTIAEAIAEAIELVPADRIHCQVYHGHDGYYSPDERIHDEVISVDEWRAAHTDEVAAVHTRHDAAARVDVEAESAALDAFYMAMN